MIDSPAIEWEVKEVKDKTQNIIKVIGVGGGGCNAVGNMYTEGMKSVTFAALNTDSKSLSVNPVPVKLMLGKSGLGAGADPVKGRKDAEMNVEDIKNLLSDGTKMCFVAAAMGGGTGTGAGPLVAGIAKEMGLLTIGIVTLPFYFERRPKIIKALKGLEEMRKNVDALLIINNEQITKVYNDSHITTSDALRRADTVMTNAVKSISELITLNGQIQTDFADVETTMRSGGGAIMAIGRASGEHRVPAAVLDALNSPLLFGNDISKAKRILINIYTHPAHELYIDELSEIEEFMDELDQNVEVIWGIAYDDTLDEDAKITILATGLDNSLPMEVSQDAKPDFNEIIERIYGRNRKVKVWNGPKTINLPLEEEDAEEEKIVNDEAPVETAASPVMDTDDAENVSMSEEVVANDADIMDEEETVLEEASVHEDDVESGVGETSIEESTSEVTPETPQQAFFNRIKSNFMRGFSMLVNDDEE